MKFLKIISGGQTGADMLRKDTNNALQIRKR